MESADVGNGNRSIHIAAQNGHLPILKLLVQKDCDVNAQNKSGQTPMHMVRRLLPLAARTRALLFL